MPLVTTCLSCPEIFSEFVRWYVHLVLWHGRSQLAASPKVPPDTSQLMHRAGSSGGGFQCGGVTWKMTRMGVVVSLPPQHWDMTFVVIVCVPSALIRKPSLLP